MHLCCSSNKLHLCMQTYTRLIAGTGQPLGAGRALLCSWTM